MHLSSSLFFKTLTFGIFFSLTAIADLTSEIGVSISTQKTNQFLADLSGNFKVENEEVDFEVGGALGDVTKTGSSISLDSNINFELDGGDKVSAEINFNELSLSFQNFEYEDITIIKRPGLTATVKNNIICDELSISLKNWKGFMQVSMQYKEKNLFLEKNGGVFEITGEDVELDLSTCTAPIGVEIIFKEKIFDWLRSSSGKELLFEQALSYGQKFVDENWAKIKKEELSFELFEKTLNVDLLDIKFFEGHIEAKGEITVKDDINGYRIELNHETMESLGDESKIILPKELFSKLIPDLMKSTVFKFDLKRAQIPGVDALFNSRFLQFFIWRDLLNFRKNVDFNAGINLYPRAVHLKSGTGKGFSYALGGRHKVDMDFLNSKGKPYPYMDFTGDVATEVDLSLNSEGLSFKIKQPKLSAKRSWDPIMHTWRKSKASGLPWMKMITPRIGKALDQTVFDYSWEDIGVEDFIKDVEIGYSKKAVILSVDLKEIDL